MKIFTIVKVDREKILKDNPGVELILFRIRGVFLVGYGLLLADPFIFLLEAFSAA